MAKSAERALKFWNSEETESRSIPTVESEVVSEGRDLTFGQFLRRERILRGISAEEIIRVTKVSPEYYAALEHNRFDQLPPKAFVVGFLRVLSRYAGLDSDELVNRFLGQVKGEITLVDHDAGKGFVRKHFAKLLLACGVVGLVVLMMLPLF